MARVLVADDEHAICQAFSTFLEREKHTPLTAYNGKEALKIIEQENPQAVFLDIQMPGMDGLETLERIHALYPDLPVIVMTAFGTMQTAMEAMRLGAFDYLTKPVDLAQIRKLLERALHDVGVGSRQQSPKPTPELTELEQNNPLLIGNSPAMQEMFKLMGLLTTNVLTVLLLGESGVGKDVVARAIHFNSDRKTRPFVALNCAAVPENLMESELFGHEKGAFTGADSRRIGRFEAAEDGTIFLDEIGELPLHMQSKLLRVLQERRFERVGSIGLLPLRARVITASNRDLEAEISAGRFRQDLYYRIKMVTLVIPPLRKRKDDLELLTNHFVERSNRELGRSIEAINPVTLAHLHQYDWPGNVRELEHSIKRAVLMAKGAALEIEDLEFEQQGHAREERQGAILDDLRDASTRALRESYLRAAEKIANPGIFHSLVAEVEHVLVEEALRITKGNQKAAAKLLGLHRTTMRKKRRRE